MKHSGALDCQVAAWLIQLAPFSQERYLQGLTALTIFRLHPPHAVILQKSLIEQLYFQQQALSRLETEQAHPLSYSHP